MNQDPQSTLVQSIEAMQMLLKKTKPFTSSTMKSAVAALYTGDRQGQLRYSNCIGLLMLDSDRHLKTNMLRFYNMETLSMVFQVELYYGFIKNYQRLADNFYFFQYPRGVIGFMFRNKDDADIMKVKIGSVSPPIQDFYELKKKRVEQVKQKKKQASFLNKVIGLFSDEMPQPKSQPGQVLKVQKAISFDINTGRLKTMQIPPEWQQIFDVLKLTPEDLNNKQIMSFIVDETVIRQVKNQAQRNQDKQLQQKIKQAEQEQQQYLQACRQTAIKHLPPPPPPPPMMLVPPPQLSDNRVSFSSKRANLMQQIRNNTLKLNHVSKINDGVNLDISNMNKEERMDHAEALRQKLRLRKKALNRREASDQED